MATVYSNDTAAYRNRVPNGMKQVEKEAFFAKIGKMDVHPRIVNEHEYHSTCGYFKIWETPYTRKQIGATYGGTPFLETQFFLAE